MMVLSDTRKWHRTLLIVTILLTFGAEPPKPAMALSAKGPWLVYSTYGPNNLQTSTISQLWAANADGSGKKLLVQDKIIVSFAAALTGGYVAYITAAYPQPSSTWEITKLTLNLLTLPDGNTRVITPLTNEQTEPKEAERDESVEAIAYKTPLQWSPDGLSLAFIGAQGGTSADLFVYSLTTNKVTQLSHGPSEAITPSWSPDGKYIVHLGVDEFGTGAGRTMAGVWAAKADNTGVITLYKPNSGDEGVLGWLDDTTFMPWTWSPDCGRHNIRAFNITTGKEDVWFPDHYDDAAWSPVDHVLLVSVGKYFCQELKPGLYIVTSTQRTPRLIAEGDAPTVEWSPGLGVFFTSLGGLGTVTPDGVISDFAVEGLYTIPIVSPDAKHLAWHGDGLMVSDLDGKNATQVSDGIAVFIWVP